MAEEKEFVLGVFDQDSLAYDLDRAADAAEAAGWKVVKQLVHPASAMRRSPQEYFKRGPKAAHYDAVLLMDGGYSLSAIRTEAVRNGIYVINGMPEGSDSQQFLKSSLRELVRSEDLKERSEEIKERYLASNYALPICIQALKNLLPESKVS